MSATTPAVIVDIDGTLCDVSGLNSFVTDDPTRKNYPKFHPDSALCPAIPDSLRWVEDHRTRGHAVLILTARRSRWEDLTRTWLQRWAVRFDELFMRADDDMRHDVAFKLDVLDQMRRAGYEPIAAIDDNPDVVALWQAQNIPVTVVPGWPSQTPPR